MLSGRSARSQLYATPRSMQSHAIRIPPSATMPHHHHHHHHATTHMSNPGGTQPTQVTPTLSVLDCFSTEGAARRSYSLLLVSLLGTALQVWIGMAAIYELSGNRVLPLQSWAWLITSQCIYAAVLWVTCYSCVSNSFISPASSNRAGGRSMHPYTSQLMNFLFVTGMQTTLVWVMYTSMDSNDRSLFDDYRFNANKPIGYNIDFNMFWYVQLYGLVLSMVGAILHLIGSWKYQNAPTSTDEVAKMS